MFTTKYTFSYLLLFLFVCLSQPAFSADVVDVKPSKEIQKDDLNSTLIATPAKPSSNVKKKKRTWFKKWKSKSLEKRLSKLLPALQFDSLKCDLIILRNGEEIEAKILEVNTGALVYQICDQENGPKRTLLNSKVFMIKYADGYKETFKDSDNGEGIDRERKKPNKNVWFIGFALGVLIGLLGVLLAYIIYRNDDYARKKAIGGALVGVLAIVLLYLYLLSLAG